MNHKKALVLSRAGGKLKGYRSYLIRFVSEKPQGTIPEANSLQLLQP